MLTRLLKGVKKKKFRLKIFLYATGVAVGCENLREISNKFHTVLMGYSVAGGKLIHEKNLKSKISWHCPFKKSFIADLRESYHATCNCLE